MGLCYPVPSRHSWEWRLGRLCLVVGLPPSAIYPFLGLLCLELSMCFNIPRTATPFLLRSQTSLFIDILDRPSVS